MFQLPIIAIYVYTHKTIENTKPPYSQPDCGTTKIINLTSDLTSLAVFVYNGKIVWALGLIAGVFSIAGNFLGAKTFVKNGTKIAWPIVILVLTALFAKILIEWIMGK